MKVTLLNHSDSLGGASVVTYRLMQALRKEGIDVRLLVMSKTGNDENVTPYHSHRVHKCVFLMERLNIFLRNGLSKANLFKVSTASHGVSLASHPLIVDADVIAINWVNQGMLSLNEIENIAQLGKPIVWTMHDMWCLTGICHHALECDGYKKQCGNCQFISGGKRKNDLSHSTWLKKQALYQNTNIQFVAVSNWLANKCKESTLLGNKHIEVIHNAFPIDSYFITPTSKVEGYGIDYNKNLILMGAARLDDPIKGFDYAIEALNIFAQQNPDMAKCCEVIFFGDIRNPQLLTKISMPYRHLGRINSADTIRQLYASAKVVISTSLYETLPGTLIEGQAAGCVPVSFGKGGQADIIDHKVTGYIADYKSSQSIADGIVWAIEASPNREMLHESVRKKFASQVIAQKYIKLFKSLIS